MKKAYCMHCGKTFTGKGEYVPDDASGIECFNCASFPDRRKVVMRCVAMASDPEGECPVRGQYLKDYDPEAHGGRGDAEFTDVLAKAKKFPSTRHALDAWRTVPAAKPLREDGRPNRPLTAFTVEILKVGRAEEQSKAR